MPVPVTINFPDELYDRARRFAHLANRDIESIITDTMLSSLPRMESYIDDLPAIEILPNDDLLIVANSQMPEQQDSRMSDLLAKQRENELLGGDTEELAMLMQVYQEGWLRKTAGLVEAVKRGLMEPIDS